MTPRLINTLCIAVATLLTFSYCRPTQKAQITDLLPQEFKQLLTDRSDILLIDVRTEEEYAEGAVEGSVLIPVTEEDFVQRVKAIAPPPTAIAVYCRSGRRSQNAAQKLISEGYCVYNLQGGYKDLVGFVYKKKAAISEERRTTE